MAENPARRSAQKAAPERTRQGAPGPREIVPGAPDEHDARVSDVTPRTISGAEARARLISGLPVTQRNRTLAGIETAVLESEGDDPIVLLHGPSAHAAHWMDVISPLAATHRVIAPDLPGHGASRIPDGVLDTERVLAWLDELIDSTCESPPVLVGQIVGGAISARYAAAHSGRLRQLVLDDTFGLGEFQPPPDFASALHAYLANPSEATHTDLWRYCALDLDKVQSRLRERWALFAAYNIERAQSPDVSAAVSRLLELFVGAIPPAELAAISVPTALIWGRHNIPLPLALAEQASARYGWPLHVIDDAADDPAIEQPQAVVRVLREILQPH